MSANTTEILTKSAGVDNNVSAADGAKAVPRLDLAAVENGGFERYRQAGEPVVLTGLFDNTPEWTLDYMEEALSEGEFNVRDCSNQQHEPDKRKWTHIGRGSVMRRMPFAEYADALRRGNAARDDWYLAQNKLRSTPLADSEDLAALGGRLGLDPEDRCFNLWLGPAGHREPLHYDPLDGTLIQMRGKKKLVLFPPTQLKNLYPFPLTRHIKHGLNIRSWFSQVDPESPNHEAFPNYHIAEQEKRVVLLGPGEAIFLPSGWWHEVTAVDEGSEEDGYVASVNHFWKVTPAKRFFGNPGVQRIMMLAPFLGLYALRSLFCKDRKERFAALKRQA